MVTVEEARELALSLGEVLEKPHFEKRSFRTSRGIFMTLDERAGQAVLRLSEMDQSLFSAFDDSVMFPVPNKWGKQGWTTVELGKVQRDTFQDAMKAAYDFRS